MNLDSTAFWKAYYQKHKDPAGASLFANFVLPFLQPGEQLLEIGCGNGRDSVFFAQHGVAVSAIDQIEEEVVYLNQKYEEVPNLKFQAGNMGDLSTMPAQYIYSRFSIHSVNREIETQVFKWAADSLATNGLFFIEVRSILDELCGQGTEVGKYEYVTDHYRRFIEVKEIQQKALDHGFRILYCLESAGLAPYKTEDPVVIRLVLQK